VLAFSVFALAAFEYYIFYKLFEGGFKGQLDFPEGGLFHKTIALVHARQSRSTSLPRRLKVAAKPSSRQFLC
jgi:hypothetical protein